MKIYSIPTFKTNFTGNGAHVTIQNCATKISGDDSDKSRRASRVMLYPNYVTSIDEFDMENKGKKVVINMINGDRYELHQDYDHVSKEIDDARYGRFGLIKDTD